MQPHEYHDARTRLDQTIKATGDMLNRGKFRNPTHHKMVNETYHDALRTRAELDRAYPHYDGNRHRMDNRYMDDRHMDDVENRRARRIRADKDDLDDISDRIRSMKEDMDDMDYDVEDRRRRGPRWRSARTGRFLPDTYRSRGGRPVRADYADDVGDDIYPSPYHPGTPVMPRTADDRMDDRMDNAQPGRPAPMPRR